MDQEEREELQELYLLWDEAIHLYEAEEFPGDYDKLNVDVENWYTYRSILSERLELVLQLLAEKQFFDFNQIEAVEVIEEDDDEKEDDEDEDSGGGNGRRETGEEEVRKEVDDEGDDEEEEDYDDADVENQLRAKYQQSKMMPLLQSLPPANPTPLLPVADAASSGPAQALARSKSGNTGFEYADVFDSTGSEDVVGNANDMLRFNK